MAKVFVENVLFVTFYTMYFGDTYFKVSVNVNIIFKKKTFVEKAYDYKIFSFIYNYLGINE